MEAISWRDVEVLADELCGRVTAAGVEPNYVIGVARGGCVPAYLVAARLGVRRIGTVGVRRAEADGRLPEITVYGVPTPLTLPDRVLLIEDATVTGRSLVVCAGLLADRGAGMVRTGALLATVGRSVPGGHRPEFVGRAVSAVPGMPWEAAG